MKNKQFCIKQFVVAHVSAGFMHPEIVLSFSPKNRRNLASRKDVSLDD